MDSISLGPFLLSTPRLLALLSLVALLACAALIGRKSAPEQRDWAFSAALCGLIGARLVYVALNWQAFAAEPLSVLYLWQGGFHPLGAAAGTLLYALWFGYRRRVAPARIALPLAVAGALWITGTLAVEQLRQAGEPLPPLALYTVDQQPVNLSQFHGRPVVLNLWATWCPPCRREMPLLEELAAAHPEVVFLLINQGETAQQVGGYLTEHELELEWVLLDPGQTVAHLFDVRGYPTTLFFDAEGRQIDSYVGELSRSLLNRQLRRLGQSAD